MSNQTPKKQRTMRDFFASPSGDATRLMASARLSDSRESLSDKSESPSTEMMSANKAIDLVTAQPVAQEAKKRKYSEDFIKFGFIASEKDHSIPICLICACPLSNASMVPNKLERHLLTNHPQHKDKPIEYFQRLKQQRSAQSHKIKTFTTMSDKAQITSYKIAQILVKQKKPHSDAETVVSPVLIAAAETMLDSEIAEKFKRIPLSRQTITRRIEDMSVDIEKQLSNRFSTSSEMYKLWALQIDESTDITGKAQLLAYIRIISDGKLVSEYFFCDELRETTTGKDIFELVDSKT